MEFECSGGLRHAPSEEDREVLDRQAAPVLQVCLAGLAGSGDHVQRLRLGRLRPDSKVQQRRRGLYRRTCPQDLLRPESIGAEFGGGRAPHHGRRLGGVLGHCSLRQGSRRLARLQALLRYLAFAGHSAASWPWQGTPSVDLGSLGSRSASVRAYRLPQCTPCEEHGGICDQAHSRRAGGAAPCDPQHAD